MVVTILPSIVSGMSSLLRPVGDQPPNVYWVRRALLGVLGVVVLVLLFRFLGGGDPKPVASSGPLDTPSPTPAATLSVPATSAGPPGTARSTDSESSAPPTRTSTTPRRDDGRCAAGAVRVSVVPVARKVSAGRPLNLHVSLSTARADGCAATVDPGRLVVTVTSGKDRIWTTSHCVKAIPRATLALAAGKPSTTTVTWDGHRSAATCPANQATAKPGTYVVQAVYAGLPSSLQAFQVV
jgi:hypothetical protein